MICVCGHPRDHHSEIGCNVDEPNESHTDIFPCWCYEFIKAEPQPTSSNEHSQGDG